MGEEFCDDPKYKENCLQVQAHESPLLGIDKHDNYDKENLQYVVVGQRSDLIDVFSVNLESYI